MLAIALASFVAAVGLTAATGDHLVAGETLFWASAGLLVYVYLGYPALLGVVRLVWRRPVRKRASEPRVCLLITANDEETVIGQKLQNSLSLDYPPDRIRILVASDGSVDRTNAIVSACADHRVELLTFATRRGKIAAINDAFSNIDEEIVVFSDANTFLAPGAVRALIANFADESVGAVSGDVVLVGERASLGRSEDLYYRYERWLQQAESDVGSMIGVDGALYAIRRELFEAPPVDTILDDMAIPMAVIRAGRRVVFEGGAYATERGSDTAREEFARKSRVVAGAVQFLLRGDSAVPVRDLQVVMALVSHKALRWLSPVFALVMFIAALALSPNSRTLEIVAGAQALSLLVAFAGCYGRLRRWTPIGFAHYFWLVQSAAAVGFIRGLRGRQAVAWRRFRRSPLETA
jgi:cellulose synthase/poly-beta-1,6-N-acetylglucosamine synthase-like glycosyltransferase